MRTLDLGCGPNPRGPEDAERWGIDIVKSENPQVIQADLTWKGIPFEDDAFDRVYAYDFLEHLPKRVWWQENLFGIPVPQTRDVHIQLFNEVYRVLKPGGVFESFTPHLPHVDEVYRDPTHVSVWVVGAWEYYAGSMVEMNRHYGYTADFQSITREWRGAHYYVELQKR